MGRSRILVLSAALFLVLATAAHAQFAPWPNPLPAMPNWGDYDSSNVWRNASWWWQNQPDWARSHHPEWWGDYYQGNWYPASWWWRYQPQWARLHHPEWWGDFDDNHDWQPAGWWWLNRP